MHGGGRVGPPRSMWRIGLAALVGASLVGGCAHRSLERLVERGEYEAAAARGASSRKPLERRAARAYAKALTALDRREEARTVLLHDFRTSGDESLGGLKTDA